MTGWQTPGIEMREQEDGTTLREIDDPGKFDGELVVSRWLWNLASDWSCWDNEVSVGEGGGWYGKFDLAGFAEVAVDPEDGDKLTVDELAFLLKQVGVIFYERSDGLVEAEYYEDKAVFESDWEAIQTQYNPEGDESEEG